MSTDQLSIPEMNYPEKKHRVFWRIFLAHHLTGLRGKAISIDPSAEVPRGAETMRLRILAAAAVAGLLLVGGLAGCGGGTSREPSGLTQEGPLDVGCQVTGSPGTSSFTATITLWNKGSTPQSVSDAEIYWTSHGVMVYDDMPTVGTEVEPGTGYTGYMSPPLFANGCTVEGWNP